MITGGKLNEDVSVASSLDLSEGELGGVAPHLEGAHDGVSRDGDFHVWGVVQDPAHKQKAVWCIWDEAKPLQSSCQQCLHSAPPPSFSC